MIGTRGTGQRHTPVQPMCPQSTALAGQARTRGPCCPPRTSFLHLSAHERISTHSPTSCHKATMLYGWQGVFTSASCLEAHKMPVNEGGCIWGEYGETEVQREEIGGVAWQLDSCLLPQTPKWHWAVGARLVHEERPNESTGQVKCHFHLPSEPLDLQGCIQTNMSLRMFALTPARANSLLSK